MKTFSCPRCEETHFATLCSDCLAEEIHIQKTRSALHIGRCHRCGHVDAEPCPSPAASNVITGCTTKITRSALTGLTQKAVSFAARATNVIKGRPARAR
jgi:NMD protein affecting ribosome stability and mRNA decay